MVEIDGRELKISVRQLVFVPADSVRKPGIRRSGSNKGHHYSAYYRRDGPHNLLNRRSRVANLAVVEISIGGEKNFWFDLTETIDNAIDAEIRRAGRPGCANAGSRQHRNDRFRTIGQIAGNTIVRGDTTAL